MEDMLRRVILEGCNGEWAQKSYLPFLAQRAANGEIELWAVDIGDEIKLGDSQAQKDWQTAQSQNKAHYLNKNTQSYGELAGANYVFVVAPDRVHSEIATFWFERLAPEGKIFIEKPLDASPAVAKIIKKHIEKKGKKEAVFAFDHYLARIHPLLNHLKEIGEIRKIEFHVLEDSKIPQEREKALDKGMVFDLFPHVLALVYAMVNRDLTGSAPWLPAVELERIEAARYEDCPISGETFAWIECLVNGNIKVVGALGKCVGTSDDKFMKAYGAKGTVELNFVNDRFFVFDLQNKPRGKGNLNSRHVESFLKEVLQGDKHLLSIPGVLSFNAAFEILKILEEAKKQIGDKLPEYQCGDSLKTILEILGEKELR